MKSVVPYLVVQHARVSSNAGAPPIDDLGSVGLGVRLSDNRHYNVDFAYAKPTADLPLETDDRKPRWNLTFSYRLQ